MKQHYLLTALLSLCCGQLWAAYDFEVGDLRYEFYDENSVWMTGPTNEFAGGDVVVPSTVQYEGKVYQVTGVEYMAFYESSRITGVTLSDGITTIGFDAFYRCPNLKFIYLPKDLEEISYDGIAENPSLETIVIDPANSIYDSRDNCNAIIESATNKLLTGCNGTVIPKGVDTIGKSAFSHCEQMKTFALTDDVTVLESSAFSDCYELAHITMSANLQVIGDRAFQGCYNLAGIELPNSLTKIDDYAFGGCYSLRDYVCYIEDPTAVTLSESGLGNNSESVLHVLPGLTEAFRNSAFGRYFKQIVDDASPELLIPKPSLDIEEGALIQLEYFDQVTLGFDYTAPSDFSLDEVYVVCCANGMPAVRVLELDSAFIEDERVVMRLKPTTTDLALAGVAHVVVRGKVTAAEKVYDIDMDVPCVAFAIGLSDESSSTFNMTRPESISFSYRSETGWGYATSHDFDIYQWRDGEKVAVANPYVYLSITNDSIAKISPQWNENLQPGIVYFEGVMTLYTDVFEKHGTIHISTDSIYYLPISITDCPLVHTPADLQQITVQLTEGFDYAHADLSASMVFYFVTDENYTTRLYPILYSPTATIEGNLLTLNFEIAQEEIDNGYVFLSLEGDIEVNGKPMHLFNTRVAGYNHPNFRGKVSHAAAEPSYSILYPDRYVPGKGEINAVEGQTTYSTLTLCGAYEASLTSIEGRLFTLVDGEEMTLCTLAEVTPYLDRDGYDPYLVLEWERQGYEHTDAIYCALEASFVVDGEEFVYVSDQSVQVGHNCYKPTPSIAEYTVVNCAADLNDLSIEWPSYMSSELINYISSAYIEAVYEGDQRSSRCYSYPLLENGAISLHLDTEYLDWFGSEGVLAYHVCFTGYCGESFFSTKTLVTFDYIYLTPAGAEPIEEIQPDAPAIEGRAYDLMGRATDRATGLRVVNGKVIFSIDN